jgi:4-hydroxybenzoate polyprenyltransferase
MKLAARARLARLDKPVGTLLTAFPAFWGLALASSPHVPSLSTAAVLSVGALFARSGGCVINDIWDKRYDAKVERTKTRPLASGELTTSEAVSTLAVCSVGAALCLIPLNPVAQSVCLGAVIPIAMYPTFKRVTYFPQVMLGLTFNLGALVGFAASAGHVTVPALLLYAGSVCWTVSYDTIYAHQDKRDDAKLQLKSTALWDKNNTIPFACSTAAAVMW